MLFYDPRFVRIAAVALVMVSAVLMVTNLLAAALLILASFAVSYAVSATRIKDIGFELVTFVAVLIGVAYSPWAGAVTGLVLILFHLAASQYMGIYVLWVVPEYFAAGMLTGTLHGSVSSIGITITILLNAFNIAMTFLIFRQNLGRYLVYAASNIVLNYVLFSFLAQPLVDIMK